MTRKPEGMEKEEGTKKEAAPKTGAALLTDAEEGQYQRYLNSHRLTGNAMMPEDWLEMTKAAEKRRGR